MDTKGRILLPKALTVQLPDDNKDQLVINCGFEKCLVLYPLKEWHRISAELAKLNTYIKENRDFIRLFNRGVNIISVDNSGRILIPKNLQEYAGLKSDVVLVTNSFKIELWDKPNYDFETNKNPEQFSELAEKVMKGIVL